MKPLEKIIIAGIAGTTLMTLYSYWKSKKEGEEYVEPIMINKLINNSDSLPEIRNKELHPAGWGLHYLTGIAFVAAYWLLWRKALKDPGVARLLVIGALSGMAGIAAWKIFFAAHDNPPHNYRHGYYRQLFTAHIIFTITAILVYKMADKADPTLER
ncbi:hypothetical protein [Flavobacterium sp.]|uniref:hypothetical protein n=1 Tax=Flavobacterium sp. TaxID=239 RepID=UPI004034902B